MTPPTDIVSAAAERLERAAESGIPCTPVRDLLGSSDIALAYQVQSLLTTRRVSRGARTVGRKIGLTSAAVQRQLGVDQPDFGVLFDDMVCGPEGIVPADRLLQPKVEAEIAFVLSAGLDDEVLDTRRVRDAVAYAVAAIEVVDSRVRQWDIQITDTVADNGSSGMFILGTDPVTLDEFEPADVEMSMSKNGTEVSTGTGAACLGDPLAALVWLARTAREYGAPLAAGEVVLSGALGPMVAVESGCQISATFSTLGAISATFL